MRRNEIFGKGRGFRVDDNQVQALRLGPRRGAAIGEYAQPESSEYSDSYYGPGRETRRRGGIRREPEMRGVVGNLRPVHSMNRIGANYFGTGERHPGDRSWADLGVSSVHPGESELSRDERASHRGRGPKGYRRSDERIKEIVCEHLTEDPYIDAGNIEVIVNDGAITLEGHVHDRRSKWYAEDLVESCTGVSEIHNRLRVGEA
jgi:hypothetical protein